MKIQFRNLSVKNEIMSEIASLPFSGILLSYLFNSETALPGSVLTDGSVLINHNFCEEDEDWILIYCDSWIKSGEMIINPINHAQQKGV